MPKIGRSASSTSASHVVDGIGHRRRIARAVAQKDPVGVGGQDIGGRHRRREHPHVAAVRGEATQDVRLDAVVVGSDPELPLRALQRRDAKRRFGDGVGERRREVVRGRARHLLDEVSAFHQRNGAGLGDERVGIQRAPVAMTPRITPDRAQLACQRARVDVADRHDAMQR